MHRQYSLLQETPHILHRNYQGRLWQSARETPFGMHIWTLGGVAYFMTIVTTPALTVQALGGAIMDTLTVWCGITLEFSKYFHDRQYYEIVCTISNKLLPSPRRTSLCMVMRLFVRWQEHNRSVQALNSCGYYPTAQNAASPTPLMLSIILGKNQKADRCCNEQSCESGCTPHMW